jgi:hypothetical protein
MASRSRNKLLASLSSQEYQRIAPHLRRVRVAAETPLPHCGDTRVYFPGMASTSILTEMSDGAMIEVASFGNEGVVGLPVLGTLPAVGARKYIQIGDGIVEYIPLPVFLRLLGDSEFARVLENYSRSFLKSMMQLAACNGRHPLRARCVRWILTTRDRLGRARFELTQPFLASVLGAKQKAVHNVMSALAGNQLLAYDSSSVTVLDPIGLKRHACSCYGGLKHAVHAAESQHAVDKSQRPRPAQRGNVVQMRSLNVCTVCGLAATPSHITHADCLHAIDKEIRSLLTRTRTLTNQRALITAEFMKKYAQFRRTF